MKTAISIFIIGFCLFSLSCVRNIEIELDADKKVVVYGMLESNTQPRIYIYQSIPFEFDLSRPVIDFIPDAEVFLLVNGNRVLLSPQQAYEKTIFRGLYQPDLEVSDSVLVTYYTADFLIESGQTYELEVNYKGERITSTTKVPDSIDFTSVEIVKDTTIDNEGDTILRDLLVIKFKDDELAENYYKYTVDYQQEAEVEGETGPEIIRVNYSFLRTRFISDKDNNGKNFTIRFILSDKVNTFQNPDYVFQIQSTLLSYDPGLITFNESLIQQGDDDFGILDPFREPVIIKSNIKGGLGIFSSVSRSPVKIVPYQPGI